MVASIPAPIAPSSSHSRGVHFLAMVGHQDVLLQTAVWPQQTLEPGGVPQVSFHGWAV